MDLLGFESCKIIIFLHLRTKDYNIIETVITDSCHILKILKKVSVHMIFMAVFHSRTLIIKQNLFKSV